MTNGQAPAGFQRTTFPTAAPSRAVREPAAPPTARAQPAPGERSTLLTPGDGKPRLRFPADPRTPAPPAWDHEPDWTGLLLDEGGVDPQLALIASDLLSALALVLGRARPLLVTTDRRLGRSRWLFDATPVGHATTSGLISHATRHLRGACEIPDLLAIRASWSLDLYDRFGARSVAGIRLASSTGCRTLLLMALDETRELGQAPTAALGALDRLARETMNRFELERTPAVPRQPSEATIVAAEPEPNTDLAELSRQALDAMVAALRLVRPQSYDSALMLASFAYLLRPCFPPDWAVVAETAALALPLGALGMPQDALDTLRDGIGQAPTDQLQALGRIPAVAAQLVARMPGLDDEQVLLERLQDPLALLAADPATAPDDEQDVLTTARLLLVAVAFLSQIRLDRSPSEAIEQLRAQPLPTGAVYEQALGILAGLDRHDLLPLQRTRVPIPKVRAGMVIAQDLRDTEGVLLLSKGTAVSGRHVERIGRLPVEGDLEMLVDPDDERPGRQTGQTGPTGA